MRGVGNKSRVCGMAAACVLALFGMSEAPCAADTGATIPFVEGLTVVSAVSEANGDYESLSTIESIKPNGYRLVRSGDAPDEAGEIGEFSIPRFVRLQDQQGSHILRIYFHSSDEKEFPGTTPFFSAAMINELRAAGRTAATYQDVGSVFGMSVVKRTLTGTLARVGPGPVDIKVLVNGAPTVLRALHVAGRLSNEDDAEDFDFTVLDDPNNGLRLRSKGPEFSVNVIKIEFPTAPEAATSLQQELQKEKKAVVYGIFFKFAKADIRPVSERVLQEIAAVMTKNPEWHLSIVGHTDNIGSDASNVELSRRRADAVKAALVQRYGVAAARLATAGYGASQPRDKNDTQEGRARNRRVELIRQ